MTTKLTLRVDERLVSRAKREARLRGKSVSQMVSEYFDSLARDSENAGRPLPPVTSSLYGIIDAAEVDEARYRRHVAEKHS